MDIDEKVIEVIRSCKTPDQITIAGRYMHRYLKASCFLTSATFLYTPAMAHCYFVLAVFKRQEEKVYAWAEIANKED